MTYDHVKLCAHLIRLEADGAALASELTEMRKELNCGMPPAQLPPGIQAETQATIAAWAERTFGEGGTENRRILRLLEEVTELALAIEARSPTVGSEGADCWIVLCRVARNKAIDILQAEGTAPDAMAERWGTQLLDQCMADILESVASFLDGGVTPVGVACVSKNLRRICVIHDKSLVLEVDRKMAINRSRKWRLTGDGHGYHTSEPTAEEPPPSAGLEGILRDYMER
jgi:hypothetical protein